MTNSRLIEFTLVYTEGVDFLMQLPVFEIGVMTHQPGEMF